MGIAHKAKVCIFGKVVCRWVHTKFIYDQGAPVSCGLRGTLCYGADGVLNSPVSFT